MIRRATRLAGTALGLAVMRAGVHIAYLGLDIAVRARRLERAKKPVTAESFREAMRTHWWQTPVQDGPRCRKP